jgi:hypothetical protein
MKCKNCPHILYQESSLFYYARCKLNYEIIATSSIKEFVKEADQP